MHKIEILNRLDKVAFYQKHIPSLKVNGRPEALGLCLFHDDHPSLSVNTETGVKQPTPEQAQKIAEVLQVNAESLFKVAQK